MKKAKIMLTLVALFCLTGGIFASRAHNIFGSGLFYQYTTVIGGQKYCTQGPYSTVGNVPAIGTFFSGTIVANSGPAIYSVAAGVTTYCTTQLVIPVFIYAGE